MNGIVTRSSSVSVVSHQQQGYMKTPLSARGESIKRTVDDILDDHRKFKLAVGDPKIVKEYNNCLQEPFFSILITQVRINFDTQLLCNKYIKLTRYVCKDCTSLRGYSRRSSHS